VLSLFTSRYWYRRGNEPCFSVEVVSVAGRPCRFDQGARSVSVVVTWGQTRIWASADCVQGTRSRAVTLTRGVPAVLQVTWNRQTSTHGCAGARRQTHLGTYTVAAYSGHLHSNTLVIRARRAGGRCAVAPARPGSAALPGPAVLPGMRRGVSRPARLLSRL
jgi:hypothetical protein